MRRPTLTKFYFVVLALSLSLHVATLCTAAHAQQPDDPQAASTTAGIALYQQGHLDEAIKVLKLVVAKHKEDVDAWYYLGLSHYKSGMIGYSRSYFERALELKPDSADANAKLSNALIVGNDPMRAKWAARRAIELGDLSVEPYYALAEASFRSGDYNAALEEADRALRVDPRFVPALLTRSMAYFNLKRNAEAAADLEQLLALNPDDPDASVWRAQIEGIKDSLAAAKAAPGAQVNDESRPRLSKEVDVKVRVVAKPEPQYSEPARYAGATGTVFLQCVFGADGEIKDILVRRAIGYGLTTRAVNAAKRIKFIPAQKDGRAVSQFLHLEYNFNLY